MIKRVIANFTSVNYDILINGITLNQIFNQSVQDFNNNVLLRENTHPGFNIETIILHIISIMLRINILLYQDNNVIYYISIIRV